MTAVWRGDETGDGTTAEDVRQDIDDRKAVTRKVLAYLQVMGSLGATTAELYGISPQAVKRLNDIRHHDPTLDYRKQREGRGYRYWLVDLSAKHRTRRSRPTVTAAAQPALF